MAATVPNHELDGFIKSMTEGVRGAFKRGVKYGRYLEQQERPEKRTGRWLNINPLFRGVYQCSACGTLMGMSNGALADGRKDNFCCECGAQMIDEEEDDGK